MFEWSPTVHLIFSPGPDQDLQLRAIILDDENTIDLKARHRAQAAFVERLAQPGCPEPRK